MGKKNSTIHAVVAPRKKQVKIMMGNKVIKTYSFKMDIPSKQVIKEFNGYDWGEWSVSDRDYTYKKEVTEWDETVMKDIRTKALEFYKSTL